MPWYDDPDPEPVARQEVPGLALLPRFVSLEKESELLAAIDAGEWDVRLVRRVQHFGFRYAYRDRQVAEPMGPMPSWLSPLCDRMVGLGFDRPANQVIVNEYLPGQGIGAHTDSQAFGPMIASLSLGGGIVMVFQEPSQKLRCELYLPPRSLLVLGGPARHEWRHSIPARQFDPGYGPRSRRVSLTFRTVA